jgi:hypothetical protein
MDKLKETAAWVNDIVTRAIETEKKPQPKRCCKAHKR